MAKKDEVTFPPGIKKYFGLALAGAGITLYAFWAIYYQVYFDLGLFSLCLCLFLFGVGFTWLFTAQDKKLKEDQRKEKEKGKKKKK
jgi:hypothetical protein